MSEDIEGLAAIEVEEVIGFFGHRRRPETEMGRDWPEGVRHLPGGAGGCRLAGRRFPLNGCGRGAVAAAV